MKLFLLISIFLFVASLGAGFGTHEVPVSWQQLFQFSETPAIDMVSKANVVSLSTANKAALLQTLHGIQLVYNSEAPFDADTIRHAYPAIKNHVYSSSTLLETAGSSMASITTSFLTCLNRLRAQDTVGPNNTVSEDQIDGIKAALQFLDDVGTYCFDAEQEELAIKKWVSTLREVLLSAVSSPDVLVSYHNYNDGDGKFDLDTYKEEIEGSDAQNIINSIRSSTDDVCNRFHTNFDRDRCICFVAYELQSVDQMLSNNTKSFQDRREFEFTRLQIRNDACNLNQTMFVEIHILPESTSIFPDWAMGAVIFAIVAWLVDRFTPKVRPFRYHLTLSIFRSFASSATNPGCRRTWNRCADWYEKKHMANDIESQVQVLYVQGDVNVQVHPTNQFRHHMPNGGMPHGRYEAGQRQGRRHFDANVDGAQEQDGQIAELGRY